MKLMELTEDEFSEFTEELKGLSRNGVEQERAKKLNNTLNKVSRDLSNAIDENKYLKTFFEEKDISGIRKSGAKLLSLINSAKNKVEVFLLNTGNEYGNIDVLKQINSIKADIERFGRSDITKKTEDGEIVHITFDRLLPKRPKSIDGYVTEKFENIKGSYIKPLIEYFRDKRVFVYEEKAIIIFIHHFSNEHNVRDHDNFELKFIIDCLSAYVLTDDSAKYLAQYMDYVMDDRDFSEIFIMPFSCFSDFWTQKQSGLQ